MGGLVLVDFSVPRAHDPQSQPSHPSQGQESSGTFYEDRRPNETRKQFDERLRAAKLADKAAQEAIVQAQMNSAAGAQQPVARMASAEVNSDRAKRIKNVLDE